MQLSPSTAIPVPTSVSAGAAIATDNLNPLTVWILGSFTATYQLQTSPDGVTFVNEGASITSATSVAVTKPTPFMRVNCTAYTSGTPTGRVIGVMQTDQ